MIWKAVKPLAKQVLPASFRSWLRCWEVRITETPMYKCVRFGNFRRVTPIHAGFGMGRGTYIDRYYVDKFLERNSASIKGRVLELSDNDYTLRYGGAQVTHSDILDVRPDHAAATIIADLTASEDIPSESFDCVILTQVLNFIYDVHAAVQTVHRILKPGGCVLVSVPGIAPLSPDEMEYCGDYWRFTRLSLKRLFEDVFQGGCVSVEAHGNVLAAVAFLHGLAVEELKPEELDYCDPFYEVSVLLKAVKAV
jgi:SAM-dependent methyltransferase